MAGRGRGGTGARGGSVHLALTPTHPSTHPSSPPPIHPPAFPLLKQPPDPLCAPKGGGAPMGFTPRAPPRQPPSLTEALQQGRPALHLQPRGGPAPSAAPPPGAQAVRGPPEQLPSPFFGCKESQRRAPATILFPFNSACGSFELSSPSPWLRPGAELPGGGMWRGGLCFSLPSLLLPPCT